MEYDEMPLMHTINKKPTNWCGQAKRRAIRLYSFGRHSVKFSVLVIVLETVTELCASIPAAPVLRTLIQYLIGFCSRPTVASDV